MVIQGCMAFQLRVNLTKPVVRRCSLPRVYCMDPELTVRAKVLSAVLGDWRRITETPCVGETLRIT